MCACRTCAPQRAKAVLIGTISATTVHVKQAELSLRVTRKSWYRYMVVDAFTKQEKPTLLTSKPYEL